MPCCAHFRPQVGSSVQTFLNDGTETALLLPLLSSYHCSCIVDDAEESDMQISDEGDEDLVDGIDDKEVHEKTAASVEDLPDLGE